MLVILTTHPIQYQVPLWQALARDGRVKFEVWFLCDHAVRATHDPEFGRTFAWELGQGSLEGYPHRFLQINERWSLHPSDFFGIRLRGSLGPLFREAGVTALWIQGWQKYAYWQAVAHAKRAGIEVWLRGETNDLAPSGGVLKGWLKSIRLQRLFSRVDRFLCIGTANRRFYLKHGVPEAKLCSAPYCVDNARFAAQAAALRGMRSQLRQAWGIGKDAFCVLFCGKFIPKKRPADLIAAGEHLMREAKLPRSIHLLFVGSGELGPELRGRCHVVFDADDAVGSNPRKSASDSRPKASFAGFRNQLEISRAYVAADVLVLPSDSGETWGLVVNEAMASGLPCIVSDAVGAGEDLVAPVDPARRFPLGDVTALAIAISGLGVGRSRPGDVAAVVGRHGFDVTIATVVELMRPAEASAMGRPEKTPVTLGT